MKTNILNHKTCISKIIIIAAFYLSIAADGMTAFDLYTMSPAERACSCPDVLGIADGSVSSIYHDSPGSAGTWILEAYGYRPFGIAGIDVFTLRGRATTRSGRLGMCGSYQALSATGYSEQTLSLSMGITRRQVWLQPGLRAGWAGATGDYGGGCVIFDFLIYTRAAPGLRVSFEIENAFAARLHVPGGLVPRRVAAGVGYHVSPTVACGLNIEKENGLPTSLGAGLEWQAIHGVFARLGSCTFPRQVSFGLGVRAAALCVDVSSTIHFDLGMTYEAGVAYIRD